MSGNNQSGVSLSGLLVGCFIIGIVAMLGLKVAPSVIEYFQIMQVIKGTAKDSSLRGATVADVRKAFQNRASIERIEDVQPADIDVTKDGNDLVLSFAYSKRIPLFANVNLLIDFEGTSSSSK